MPTQQLFLGIISGERRRTHAEVADRASRIAGGLKKLGVGQGDSVCMLMRNDIAFMEAAYAAMRLGAYGVPINWHPRCAAVLRDRLQKFEKNLLLISVIDLTHGETPDDVAMTASELAGMLDALSRNKELDLKPGEKTDAI